VGLGKSLPCLILKMTDDMHAVLTEHEGIKYLSKILHDHFDSVIKYNDDNDQVKCHRNSGMYMILVIFVAFSSMSFTTRPYVR
jgi:hypothetical protein